MSARETLGRQFQTVRDMAGNAADIVTTYGRMLTVGHVNYRDAWHRGTPEERASAQRGWESLQRRH